MGVNPGIFNGLVTMLLIVGTAIGAALVGLVYLIFCLCQHLHWSWT